MILPSWILIIPLGLLLAGIVAGIKTRENLYSFIAGIIALAIVYYIYTLYDIPSVTLSSYGRILICISAIIIYYLLRTVFKE